MVGNLNTLISQVQASATQITGSSAQVTELSQSLSDGASNSASSITEISAVMTQMAAQTTDNAANAKKADERSQASRADAGESDKLMSELIAAMAEIDDSGEEHHRDYHHHRQHRRSNQPAGVERSYRGRTRRRTGAWFCGGRRRSQEPRRPQRRSRPGNRRADCRAPRPKRNAA